MLAELGTGAERRDIVRVDDHVLPVPCADRRLAWELVPVATVSRRRTRESCGGAPFHPDPRPPIVWPGR